jgi:hypothetical protein
MKKTFYILLLTLFNLVTYSQETNSTLTDRLKEIINSSTNSSVVGRFDLLNNAIPITNGSNSIVDSVFISIDCGYIKEIDVYINGSRFVNREPIPLKHYGKRTDTQLHNYDIRFENQTIVLGDFLRYNNATGNNFTTGNIVFKLANIPTTTESNSLTSAGLSRNALRFYELKLDESIASLIDYRIYSDFLALIDESTNGIVNFEGKANIPLFTKNIFSSNLYFLKTISPELRYSRFDNKDRLIDIDITGDVVNIKDNLDILQKSYLSTGIHIEALKYNPKNSFIELSIPIFIHFLMAENKTLQDNEISDAIKENFTSARYGTGINFCVNRSKNFVFNLDFNFYQIEHLNKDKYQMQNVSNFKVYNLLSELSFVGKDVKDAVFLRFNYTSEFDKSNNFFQLQIGYKSSFNL